MLKDRKNGNQSVAKRRLYFSDQIMSSMEQNRIDT